VIAAIWLAAAVLLAPPRGAADDRRDRRDRLAPSRTALAAGGGVGTAVVIVVLLGVHVGVPVALVGAPVAGWALHRLPAARPAVEPGLALTLDLIAAALHAGRPVAQSVELALVGAPDGVVAVLTQVAALLRLGADPDEAWRPAAEHHSLAPVATAARRSSASGAKLAAAFGQCAVQLRLDAAAEAHGRAARAGVLALLPLGVCFLPAFVCIGVVPVVAGVARTAFLGGAVP
jgi:Flp pilus assembly protein TadB